MKYAAVCKYCTTKLPSAGRQHEWTLLAVKLSVYGMIPFKSMWSKSCSKKKERKKDSQPISFSYQQNMNFATDNTLQRTTVFGGKSSALSERPGLASLAWVGSLTIYLVLGCELLSPKLSHLGGKVPPKVLRENIWRSNLFNWVPVLNRTEGEFNVPRNWWKICRNC